MSNVGDGLRAAADEHVDFDRRLSAVEGHVHESMLDQLGDLKRRVTVLEGPVAPPAPPGYDEREPFVIDGADGEVVEGFRVHVPPGGGHRAVTIRNSRHVVLRNFQVNRQIRVVNSSDVLIELGLVAHDDPGSPNWSDNEAGVRFLNSSDVELRSCVVAYFDCNIRAEASHRIVLLGNFTYNPRGPFPRGQHFQSWEYGGKRSSDLLIRDHYALTDFTRPGPHGTFQEDAFNVSAMNGVMVQHVLSEMVGGENGFGSGSGTGFITEMGSSDIHIDGFTSVGHANHGLSISGGSNVTEMKNTLLFFDGAGTDGPRPAGGGRTAGVVRQGSVCRFGENVRMYGTKSRTDPLGWFWQAPNATTFGKGGVEFDRYESDAARAALEALDRTQWTIPDVGFEFP